MAKQISERERLWPEGPAAQTNPVSAQSAVPKVSEQKRQAAWAAHRSYFTQLLDEPVPMLGGLTPRAVAQDPARRAQLVDWLKAHLHHLDVINRRDGLDLHIDWVLDELGVTELK